MGDQDIGSSCCKGFIYLVNFHLFFRKSVFVFVSQDGLVVPKKFTRFCQKLSFTKVTRKA